jgi:uncharacterized repeat protein (TIGR01451 family)
VEIITNTVIVTDDGSNGADPTPENNSATDTDVVEAAPDLAVSKDDGRTTALPGETLTYTLAITNGGSQEATAIIVTDKLPLNTSFITASHGANQVGNLVTWPSFNLPAGVTATRTLMVKVDDQVPTGTMVITNTASVSDDGTNGNDPIRANNTFTKTTLILPGNEEPGDSCELYPIALHTETLAGVAMGETITDIFNGTRPGNFGWLTWTGANSVPTLIKSLTPPGDSHTYINPLNPADHIVSAGDFVRGKPGVSNAKAVRDALNILKTIDITVPVWNVVAGNGTKTNYRVTGFASIRLIDYKLPEGPRHSVNNHKISVRFLGFVSCNSSESIYLPLILK